IERNSSEYFVQTSVCEWDSLNYFYFWQDNISATPDKAAAFNIQIGWLIENGNENEKEKAEYLKEQFQGLVGLRLLHDSPGRLFMLVRPWDYASCTVLLRQIVHSLGTRETTSPARTPATNRSHCRDPWDYVSCTIDSKKGGRVHNFWQEKMRAKKLNETKKDASIDAENRILTVRNDTESNTLNDDEPDYEGLTLLFDKSNEDILVESIDEKLLEQENVLPKASGDKSTKNMDPRIVEAFCGYQVTIPKNLLDLTDKSLFDCKQITEADIMQLLQDFVDKISWKMMPNEQNICEYLNNNCEQKTDNNFDIRKLDKSGIRSFQGMMMEEELKMYTTFPFFRGIFTSDKIKNTW
ncbi:2132_t:CDS:2, partial [Gigaspora rosea]